MPKQVFRIRFFVFFLLSLIQISYSKSKEDQTISEAPKYDQPSTPSPDYTKDSSPGDVEEPEFFSPEGYPLSSPAPVSETLDTQLATNDYNVSLNRAAVHETDDYNTSLNKAPARAPSTDFPLPEVETVSSEPEFQPEAEDYKAQVKAPEPAPLQEVILPETNESSAKPEAEDDYSSPIKTSSVPAPSIAIPSTEMDTEITQVAPSVMALDKEVGVSPAPNPSILPSKAEDADTLALEPDQNIDHNSTTEDSSIMSEDQDNPTIETPVSTSPELDMESTKVAPPVDEDVDMPPIPSNSVMTDTYTAEAETVDIVYEGNEGGWGSRAGQNNGVKVAEVMIGLCLIGLAGLVYNGMKKKKTQFQYEPLSKGL